MKLSVCNNEVEYQNSIRERVNKCYQVFVKDKEEDHNSIWERMNE